LRSECTKVLLQGPLEVLFLSKLFNFVAFSFCVEREYFPIRVGSHSTKTIYKIQFTGTKVGIPPYNLWFLQYKRKIGKYSLSTQSADAKKSWNFLPCARKYARLCSKRILAKRNNMYSQNKSGFIAITAHI
jgi:hypothetical protein